MSLFYAEVVLNTWKETSSRFLSCTRVLGSCLAGDKLVDESRTICFAADFFMDKISLDSRDADLEKDSSQRVKMLQGEWQQVRILVTLISLERPFT